MTELSEMSVQLPWSFSMVTVLQGIGMDGVWKYKTNNKKLMPSMHMLCLSEREAKKHAWNQKWKKGLRNFSLPPTILVWYEKHNDHKETSCISKDKN